MFSYAMEANKKEKCDDEGTSTEDLEPELLNSATKLTEAGKGLTKKWIFSEYMATLQKKLNTQIQRNGCNMLFKQDRELLSEDQLLKTKFRGNLECFFLK